MPTEINIPATEFDPTVGGFDPEIDTTSKAININRSKLDLHVGNNNNPHNVIPTQQDSIDYTLLFDNALI